MLAFHEVMIQCMKCAVDLSSYSHCLFVLNLGF
jgi:hypothetical protein